MTLLLLAACGVTYSNTELQLDLAGALPAAAETMHVCVEDEKEVEEGAGNGRIAVVGLWPDRDAVTRVELYDVDGQQIAIAGPVTIPADGRYATATLTDPDGDRCQVDKSDKAPDSGETWVLGVRFSED